MSALIDVRLAEWESLKPSESTAGRVLRGVWLEDARSRKLAEGLSLARVLHIDELRDGLSVRATSFVGRVQLGRVRITIEPKVAKGPLLRLFRYAFGLRPLMLLSSSSAETGALFQDVLLHQLRAEVQELHRRGLMQRYLPKTEFLASPRGRIDTALLAARGGLLEAALPCRHAPRTMDHLLNRVVAAGVQLGSTLAQDPGLRHALRSLDRTLEEQVTRMPLDRDALLRAESSLSRLSVAYEPTLRILGVLLDGLALSLEDGETLPVPGFLFDMNRFFQALVERLLRDHLPDHDVRAEVGLSGMMRYVQNPRNRRAPEPRPDITVREKATGNVTLLDAKYRDLWEKPLPRDMLYQLALYAVSQKQTRSAAMIFPTAAKQATPATVEVRDPLSSGRLALVHLRPLDVELVATALDAPHGSNVLAEVARGLAFERPRSAGSPAL